MYAQSVIESQVVGYSIILILDTVFRHSQARRKENKTVNQKTIKSTPRKIATIMIQVK